jgi:hypothetical protein
LWLSHIVYIGQSKAEKKSKRKKRDPAIYQQKKEEILGKKQIAEDVLESHGYKVRGGGLTASGAGNYVASGNLRPTCV